MIGVMFAVAPLYLATAGLVVLGEGQDGCPTAASVSQRLSQFLDDDAGARVPDALVLDGVAGALRVRLLSSENSLREQKTLDLQGSCDELADAVATVAVAWRSHLQSGDVPPPVLEARPLPAPPVLDVEEEAPPPAPARPPRLSAPPTPDFEIVYGIDAVTGDHRWAPGLLLAAQAPIRRDFSMSFTLNVPAPRSEMDPTGKSWRWMEVTAVIAPSFRVVTRNFFIDTHAGLGTGVNVTISESLSAHDSYHLVPPAVAWGIRWTYWHSEAHPWFGMNFAARFLRTLESPIHNAEIASEPWVLGLALGGTLSFDRP